MDCNESLSGHVEIVEPFVGGKLKGKGRSGRTGYNKVIVMGMVERGGDVIARVIENT